MRLPEITTRRLVLRPLGLGDADAIRDLGGRDFEVARWMTSFPWPYEDGAAEAFVRSVTTREMQQGVGVFAITLGGILIGVVSIEAPGDLPEALPDCPTIGYWLGRPFHGFGYGREAAHAVVEWGFANHTCEAIAARVFEDNVPSRQLLRKLGFRPFGKTVRYSRALDRKIDNVIVCLTRNDFDMQGTVA